MRAKIRIGSDGTRPGTNIFAVTPEGEETALAGITGVDWTLDVRTGIATATLRVHRARLDALLEAGHVVAILEPAPRRPRRMSKYMTGTVAAGVAGFIAALYDQPLWIGMLTALAAGALTDGLIWIFSGLSTPPNPRPQPQPQPPRAGVPTTDFVPDPPCAADRRLRAIAEEPGGGGVGSFAPARDRAHAFRAAAEALSPCPRCGGTDPWDRRPVNFPGEGIVPCPHAWHEHTAWRGRAHDAVASASIALSWRPWFDVDELEMALGEVLEQADHDDGGGFSAPGYNPAGGLTPEEWQAKRLTDAVLSFLFDVDSRRVTQRRST